MKWLIPPRLERYSFLFSMPLVGVALNQVLYGDRWMENTTWLISFPLIFLIAACFWYVQVVYAHNIENIYPSLKQSTQRILWKALALVTLLPSCVVVILYCFDHFHIAGYALKEWDMIKALAIGFSTALIFETLYESDYVLTKYKESVEEKETLRQVAVEHDFEALKDQVNPHFLFNCFNTLSLLISEDKERAEAFLNELSKVYRYLLRNNEDGLSTVENEIRFIRSYYSLLQTRHGEAVKLEIAIDKRYESYLVPSLSLQLLVENAVKHNILSKNNPLAIDIFTVEGNKLVVNNNLQRRTAKVLSNKVGLTNIQSKYALLEQEGFQVMDDGINFTVVLPLIWDNATKNRNVLFKENKSL